VIGIYKVTGFFLKGSLWDVVLILAVLWHRHQMKMKARHLPSPIVIVVIFIVVVIVVVVWSDLAACLVTQGYWDLAVDLKQEFKGLQKSRKQWMGWLSLERQTHAHHRLPTLPPHLLGSSSMLPITGIRGSRILSSRHSTLLLPVDLKHTLPPDAPQGGVHIQEWYVPRVVSSRACAVARVRVACCVCVCVCGAAGLTLTVDECAGRRRCGRGPRGRSIRQRARGTA
jgi:hypothetical protein